MRLIERLGLKFGGLIDRANPQTSSPVNLLVNGYTQDSALKGIANNKNITPVFAAVHLAFISSIPPESVQDLKEALEPHQPIGCRDKATTAFLKSQGLEVLYNYCLSLTLERRDKEPVNGRVVLVDVPDFFEHALPSELQKNCWRPVQHWLPHCFSSSTKMRMAEELLSFYRNHASLIITARLHCALPCIAMGIPTILFDGGDQSNRLETASEFIPVTKLKISDETIDDRKRYCRSRRNMLRQLMKSAFPKYKDVDWNPKCPNIEDTKEHIRNRVKEMLQQRLGD